MMEWFLLGVASGMALVLIALRVVNLFELHKLKKEMEEWRKERAKGPHLPGAGS